MKDIFGKAILDYYDNNYTADEPNSDNDVIMTWTNISDIDQLPISYLFRPYVDMPKLEQKALQLATGNVLDVGCGAGIHALYLQNKGFSVKAIDVSEHAIMVCKKRGVINAESVALMNESETFDTILLLMNGTGIFEELSQVSIYLSHLKCLLNTNGQILIDSSDIKYMYFDEAEDEVEIGDEVEDENRYYGELDYFISYKGEEELPMKWLYLDFETLKMACKEVGLECEKVMDGEHFDYLAKLYALT
jgi:SAM-dependent methyltransferase